MPRISIAFFKHGPRRQHGAALLIILLILVAVAAAVILNSLTSSSLKNARQANTAAALAQAKAALIGYAITYGDNPSHSLPQVDGYLPCPDIDASNGEGSSNLACGSQNVSVIGRLPWATLDLPALRDGDGECMWYAVSGTYKNNPKTSMMNWDTNGQFQAYAADGTQLTNPNEVVAVVFAPGAPLSGQSQDHSPSGSAPICGGNYTAAHYLDTGTVNTVNFNNADIATGKFIQGTSSGSINDQMVFITKQDIWNAVQKRTDFQNTLNLLTQRVAECIANYGRNNSSSNNYSLPWPAPVAINVTLNNNYDDYAGIYAGRVPNKVNDSRSATGNSIGTYTLLATTGFMTCPSADWSTKFFPWWVNWKEHLYYAVSYQFRPTLSTYQSCSWFSQCLSINGSGHYAAVVMFAGAKLPALNQTRANNADPSQYLEGYNASNLNSYLSANGNENYQSGPASGSFNDVLCYINDNLQVTCP
jgi:type II secretory pathway pseudopilin PulG